MSNTRHAPDPLHTRETLCGAQLVSVGNPLHLVVSVGDHITCPSCRVVINMARKCIAPGNWVLARAP